MVSSYNDQHITYFFTQLIIMRISIHSSLGDRHPQYPIFITDFLCQKKITSTLDGHISGTHTFFGTFDPSRQPPSVDNFRVVVPLDAISKEMNTVFYGNVRTHTKNSSQTHRIMTE